MVIDDDQIEFEIRALRERTLNGFENSLLAIPDRDDYAGFHWKCFHGSRNFLEVRLQPGTDSFEMRCRNALHFNLVIAIARIHIIELPLTYRPRINYRCAIQRF